MNCLKCKSSTSVVDSRPLKFCKKMHREASAIKRRRKCNSCGHRFNTIEQLLTEKTVVKTVVLKEKVKVVYTLLWYDKEQSEYQNRLSEILRKKK